MKKIYIIILVFLPLITYGQANKIYRKALRATDLNERIALFTQVIELDPKKLDAYFYRAIAKNDLGDYSSAIVDYSKVIVFEPDADTYFNRGNSKYSLDDIEGAKADYENAVKLDPNFTDAIYSLGCAKYDLEDYENAIVDFTKVLKQVPRPKVFTLRASAYRALKDYKNALKDYTYAILMTGNDHDYYNRGEFYLSVNLYKKANADFSKSIKINSNNSFSYFYRGTTYLLLGKYQKAVSDFTRALEFDPTDFDAMLGLALSYNGLNDVNNAKLNFQKAKTILSSNNNDTDSIALFKNTYWYQNQNFVFSRDYRVISKL